MDKTLNDNSILELLKSIQSELSGLHKKVRAIDMSDDDRRIVNAYIYRLYRLSNDPRHGS